ncbi:hypothetical protein GCM10027592_30960 [Spirosoma flavus]
MKPIYKRSHSLQWLYLLWAFFFSLPLKAQIDAPPALQWQQVIKGNGLTFLEDLFVAQGSDGGYGVLHNQGLTYLSPSGEIRLQVALHENKQDSLVRRTGIVPTDDGGFVVLGNSSSELLMIRKDRAGRTVWKLPLTNSRSLAVLPYQNNNYLVFTSYYQGNLFKRLALFVVSADGRLLQSKDVVSDTYFRDTYDISFQKVVRTRSSYDYNYWIIGDCSYNQKSRGLMVKLDEIGNLLSASVRFDISWFIDATPNPYENGTMLALASINTASPGVHPFKTQDGAFIQMSSYALNYPNEAYAKIASDGSGQPHYALLEVGTQNRNDFQLRGFNQQGNVLWTKTLGGSGNDTPSRILTTSDGYLLLGTTSSTDGDVKGKQDIWVVKLQKTANPLTPLAPIYSCQTGNIFFKTSGGDGSPITFQAPGVRRDSPTNNFGVVADSLRNDPNVIPITATQNAISVTYNFDLKAACTNVSTPQSPRLREPIPDQTLVAGVSTGSGLGIDIGNYFTDPNTGPGYKSRWEFTTSDLPPGLKLFTLPVFTENSPYAYINGLPTTPGTYPVAIKASTGILRNSPVVAHFTIRVLPNLETKLLVLTQPYYSCQSGYIAFNTLGGDGSDITFRAPGVTRDGTSSRTGVVEQELRNDPKPIAITATQSGKTATYVFDFGAFCKSTQPPIPPTSSVLTLLAPTYDCNTGAFRFNTSGGDGSSIDYFAPGITGWTTNPNQFVDKDSRIANDVQPFTLTARQNGKTVTYVWNLKTACNRARAGVDEVGTGLDVRVLGNPVEGKTVDIEIGGVVGKTVHLQLADSRGQLVYKSTIQQADVVQHVSIPVDHIIGILLLQVSTDQAYKKLKIVKR